jgi:hypothetical protein
VSKLNWTDAEKRRMKQLLDAVDEMSEMYWDLQRQTIEEEKMKHKGDGACTMFQQFLASDFIHSKQAAQIRGFKTPGGKPQGKKALFAFYEKIRCRDSRSITPAEVAFVNAAYFRYHAWYTNGERARHEKYIDVPETLVKKGVTKRF